MMRALLLAAIALSGCASDVLAPAPLIIADRDMPAFLAQYPRAWCVVAYFGAPGTRDPARAGPYGTQEIYWECDPFGIPDDATP